MGCFLEGIGLVQSRITHQREDKRKSARGLEVRQATSEYSKGVIENETTDVFTLKERLKRFSFTGRYIGLVRV